MNLDPCFELLTFSPFGLHESQTYRVDLYNEFKLDIYDELEMDLQVSATSRGI